MKHVRARLFGHRRSAPIGVGLRGVVAFVTLLGADAHLSITCASECHLAAQAAEQAAGLPAGILSSIGHVESGSSSGMAWTVNANQQGRHFDSRADAEAYAGSILDSGQQMIDLGCFQIDLLYHPDAFKRWQDAFDPTANATAAAAILKDLHNRTNDWDKAISLYHSADPARGLPYMNAVLRAWGLAPSGTEAFDTDWTVSDQFTILMSLTARSIHVWGPDAPLGNTVHPDRTHATHMPAVITP